MTTFNPSCHRIRQRVGLISVLLLIISSPLRAQDSGLGIDLHFGIDLDPARMIGIGCSADGPTWLTAERKRTPSGFLYDCIPKRPEYKTGHHHWQYQGAAGIGYLIMGGDENAAMWRRFNNYDDGVIFKANLSMQRPLDGRYLEIDTYHINPHAHYYRILSGQAGKYRLQVFSRGQSNVLSDNTQSLWQNPGAQHLMLKPGLLPGNENAAALNTFMANDAATRVVVIRSKQGAGISYYLNPRWTAFANASHERREGSRPFGGPFSFGRFVEILRPIDDNTTNFNGGLRFVGNDWRMEFNYTGSFFRNGMNYFTYEAPQASLSPAINPIGLFSYEPENDYHRIGATFTRRLRGDWNGEFTVGAAFTHMRQNADLVPSLLACNNPTTGAFTCSDWNTPASLSQRRADLAVNNQRLLGRLVLQPSDKLTWNSTFNFFNEDYSGNYIAYNPLTGQYGYPAENGAFSGLWNAGKTNSVHVRNLLLDKKSLEFSTGLSWIMDERNTLGSTYTHTRLQRDHREFSKTNEDQWQLSWINRNSDGWLTTRINYAYADRQGKNYNFDPYEFMYSVELPGANPTNILVHTTSALRKYDVGQRQQHKVDVMLTMALPQDMTVYTSLRAENNHYPTQIGRTGYNTLAGNLQWEWQPNFSSTISAWYGYDRSKLNIANVNDDNITPGARVGNPALGGPAYPESWRWWMTDKQHNHSVGLNLRQKIRRAIWDVDWNYMHSKGMTSWVGNSLAAGPQLATDGLIGRFPAMRFQVHSLSTSLQLPITQRTNMRLFSSWERGKARDWHYDGINQTPAVGNMVLIDGGPSNYNAHLIGLMVEIAL